ncbi:MAG TPA: alpha/beta hydrolase [Gemmatimonadaceae bacterium]|nr:alpha/beta hydrolase [Gemmatimonadaceae bacterium]
MAFAQGSAHGQTSTPREGYLVTSDSVRLFYRVLGNARDTIVAIHGGPGVDLESLYGDFARLAARHTIIFYDQRGTGRSDLPDTSRLTAERQISDLEAVRRHFGLDRMTLMAHSYGPLLAATYALAHPEHVRRMVFFGPVPPRRGTFWERFRTTSGGRVDSSETRRMADARRRLMDPGSDARIACRDYWAVAILPRVYDRAHASQLVKADLCASDPAGIRYGLTVTGGAVWASYGDWDLRERLRTLAVPTLIVHGTEDAIPMDLVEEWATSLPRATLVRVPRAAHWVYAERPDEVWPRVEAFLRQ